MISGCHLRGRDNFFAHADDAGHFASDRFGVFNFQRACAAPAGADATRRGASGKDQDHVLSKAGDLRFHLRLGAVADPGHRNDCPDADDDSQRSEHGTHFVAAQRAVGNVKCGRDSHLVR